MHSMHLVPDTSRPEPTPPTSVSTGVRGKIAVVMPTYNEADNLPAMVAELLALDLDHLEIVVVDDNSPDGTGDVANRLAGCYPEHIQVIRRSSKGGLGSAYRRGIRLALERGAQYVIEMDADCSHSPTYIPTMLEMAEQYDVVVGSRYVSGGAVDDRWRLWRRFLSRFANSYARAVTGLRVRDTTAGFKVFRREVLETIDLSAIKSDGYAFQIEMAYACQEAGYRICEVPIFFEDRVIGNSKMGFGDMLEAFWRVWQIRLRY